MREIRNIADIIETLGNVEDTYIIITSREVVFKQFEKSHKATLDIRKFERRIGASMRSPSYDYEKKKGYDSKIRTSHELRMVSN